MSVISRFLLGYFSIGVVLTTILILSMIKLDDLIEKSRLNWVLAMYLIEIKFAFQKSKSFKKVLYMLVLLLTLPIILLFVILKWIKDFFKNLVNK